MILKYWINYISAQKYYIDILINFIYSIFSSSYARNEIRDLHFYGKRMSRKSIKIDKSFGRRMLEFNKTVLPRNYNLDSHYLKIINKKDYNIIHYLTVTSKDLNVYKADIIRIHGMGGYGASFLANAKEYISRGYRLHLVDLPGHGYSDGMHCDIKISECVSALELIMDDIKKLYRPQKTILQGNSLGGLVSIKYCLKHTRKATPINGLSLTCPCIGIGENVGPNKIVIFVGKLLNLFFSKLAIIGRGENLASLNPNIDEAFYNDPLNYRGRVRIGTGLEILKTLEKLKPGDKKSLFKNLDIPFICQQGENDRVIDPRISKTLYDQSPSLHKKLIYYPKCEHEMFSERCRDQVFIDMFTWLDYIIDMP